VDSKEIGFIGLGLMGHGIAKNLQEKGHRLRVIANRNRAPVDDLVQRGAREAKSLREVIDGADILVTCVPTSRDVEAIVYGSGGVIETAPAGFTHIDTTTADPNSTLRIAADYAARGIRMVDCPLARGPADAEAGRLNLIVGAEDAVLEEVRPVLGCFSENVFHAGGIGAGHKMKLINNFIAMGTANIAAEAMAAAKLTGVDQKVLYDLISAGGNNSGLFQIMALSAMDGDCDRLKFAIGNACKDIGYFTGMMNDARAATFMGGALLQMLTLAVRDGHAERFVPFMSAALGEINRN
jgi:3-hydroxyisobutyrate dehydrogenase-like beta-hydroxyacid dehydrogenase